MEQKVDDLGRQVKELERTVERLRLESVSRFDPYFGSIKVDVEVNDDILFSRRMPNHDIYLQQAEQMDSSIFVDQLFPGLATTLSIDNSLDVDEDIDRGIPPTPTSLFSDIFPDLVPLSAADSDSGPCSPVPALSISANEIPFIGAPESGEDTDVITVDESLPRPVEAVDSESRQDRKRSNRHRLEELGDWAKHVLFIVENNGDGEEIGHLEWTWELIKQFQSCIDSQKSEHYVNDVSVEIRHDS
jgi:hypothetical protein